MPESDMSGLGGLGGLGGPSDETWIPTPGFPAAPSNGRPPSQPNSVLGTDQLQKAVDKFDATVQKLEKLAQKQSGMGTFGSSRSANGGGQQGLFGALGGSGGIDLVQELFGSSVAKGGGKGGLSDLVSLLSRGSGGGHNNGGHGSSGPGFGNGGGQYASGNGGGASFGGSSGGSGGGSGGSGSGSGTGNGGSGGGGGFIGGAIRSAFSSRGTAAVGVGTTALAVADTTVSYGKKSLPAQLDMSAMQQQGLLWAPQSTTNYNVYGDRMRAQAFGSGGPNYKAPPNNYALNAQDAAQGYGTLQQMSGTGIVSQSSVGQFGLGAAASFVGANPQLSYTQSAQMAQQMAMPSMSLRMTQLGYQNTPLQMGAGKANSMGSVMQGMLNRMFPGQTNKNGAVNLNNLNASLATGQVGWADIQQIAGGDQQLAGALTSTLQGYDRAMSQGHMTSGQVQQLFTKAQGGDKKAQQTLDRYGVTQGDLGQMKKVSAQKTMNQSDTFDSFSAGLSKATGALTDFQKILNAIVNTRGINQLVGGGGGIGSQLSSGLFTGATMFGGAKLASSLFKGGKGLLSGVTSGGGEAAAGDAAATAGIGAGGIMTGAALTTLASMWLGGKTGKAAGKAAGTDKKKTGIGDFIGSTLIDSTSALPGGPSTSQFLKNMFGFSHGGRINEGIRGKDTQPAMLAKDEVVVNANAAQDIGYDYLDAKNRQHSAGGIGGGTEMNNGVLYAASGAAILQDAKKYAGHKYVYGGPSNPQSGWDCSSFTSWVLGHDMKLGLPGGSWDSVTNKGKAHGPVASAFAHLPGAHKVGSNPKDIQQGDVLVWSTHVGFGVGPGTMFSAYDTAQGTIQSRKDMKNAGGPSGESLTIMRYGAGGGTGGTGGGGTGSTSGSSASTMTAGTGGGYNAISEAANVESALGGGGSSVNLGVSSKGPAGDGSKTTPGVGGGKYPNKSGSGIPQNAQAIANFLSGKGANKVAVAGILGNIEQESGGNWDIGGGGLIQILGAKPKSLQDSLNQTWTYIQQNGGIGPVNKAKNAADAATIFSQQYERPGNPMLSNRIRYANEAWAAGYASGTSSTDAGLAVVGERGPELVNLPAGASITDAGTTRKLMNAQGVAQAPWSTGGSLNSGGSGVTVQLTFEKESVVVNQTGSSRDSASNAASEIVQKVKQALQKEDVYSSIRQGNKRG